MSDKCIIQFHNQFKYNLYNNIKEKRCKPNNRKYILRVPAALKIHGLI